MDITLSVIIMVVIMYVLFMIIGAIFIIKKKKAGSFKQTIDPKPEQNFNVRDEQEKR